MSSILDQTLLASNSSYAFYRSGSKQPISSYSEGGWNDNRQIAYVVPKKIQDENGMQVIPVYNTSTGELNIPELRKYSLNANLEQELKGLFDSLLDIDIAGTNNLVDRKNILMEQVYVSALRKAEMIDFADEVTDSGVSEAQRIEFQNQKNRLLTLMNKNRNIKNRLNHSVTIKVVLLSVLVLYVMMLSSIYIHGKVEIGLMNNLMNKSTSGLVLILISLLVVFIYVIIDVYTLIYKKKSIEEFVEGDPLLQPAGKATPSMIELVAAVRNLISKLPMVADLKQKLRENVSDKQGYAIQNILSDFSNMNFINMRRYQLNDFKLNKNKQTIDLSIKYAFLLVSFIGLLAGLNLRSEGQTTGLVVTGGMFMTMSIILMIVYTLVLIRINRQNRLRRQYNWNMLYFNTEDTGKMIQN